MNTKTLRCLLAIAALEATLALGSASQATNLVTNGGFESNNGNGQLGYSTSATGWSVPAPSGSYAFLFGPGTADTSGANGQYGGLSLWGPVNGSANGLPATSPDGGFFVALDSAFQPGALSQTISGLTPGQTYNVSFWWAAAQQHGFTGPTYDDLQVSLGSSSVTTPTLNLPNHGFSGWQQATVTLTADSSTDVLSFLAQGGPPGVPPFALLDGVSLDAAVPEPAAWLMMVLGVFGLGLALRHRKRQAALA